MPANFPGLRRASIFATAGAHAFAFSAGSALAKDKGDFDFPCFLFHGAVVVSSTSYERTQGAVASLTTSTTLPDIATERTTRGS